ncbi:MAG: YtxH domain-containing protein [Caldilineaceae bacterium]|nr:YtxH domain-containing protein [Caldilineaceae bacterium]
MGKSENFIFGALVGAALGAVIGYLLGPAQGSRLDVTYQSRLDKALDEGRRAEEAKAAELRQEFVRAKRGNA